MAFVAALYGLSEKEATSLTDAETNFLLDKAETQLSKLAIKSPEFQKLVRPQLDPILKTVKGLN